MLNNYFREQHAFSFMDRGVVFRLIYSCLEYFYEQDLEVIIIVHVHTFQIILPSQFSL